MYLLRLDSWSLWITVRVEILISSWETRFYISEAISNLLQREIKRIVRSSQAVVLYFRPDPFLCSCDPVASKRFIIFWIVYRGILSLCEMVHWLELLASNAIIAPICCCDTIILPNCGGLHMELNSLRFRLNDDQSRWSKYSRFI